MKTSQIAFVAALGLVAVALPAAAAPTSGDGLDVRAARPASMQLAQNATRAINEARGGNFKSTKPKKKKKNM